MIAFIRALPSTFLFSQFLFSQSSALHGIDVGDLDRKVDPCTDFYEFANGTWRANHPIPATMVRWSKRWESDENTKVQLKEILDDAQHDNTSKKGTPGQIIGDYYGACMDEANINVRGAAELEKLFATINLAKDNADLQSVIAEMHDIMVAVPFKLASSTDVHDPSRVLANLGANGYSLPGRDYYLKPDSHLKEVHEKYLEHIARMFALAGSDPQSAAADAHRVLSMETHFAEATLDSIAIRDPNATDHNMKFAQLQALVPHFDWSHYFNHNQLSQDVDLSIDQPRFMQEFDRQLELASLADWKAYLKWQVLNSSVDALPAPIEKESFAFFGKYLRGQSEMRSRWKLCVESTDRLLGEALGQKYVERYFPPEAKMRTQELVRNILATMKDDILSRPWLGDETKERALAKIATLDPKIGYPDKWKDYTKIDIRRDTFFEDYLAARRFVVRDDRETIGKPVDRSRWNLTPPTSDAYYNPLENEIVFPAGILQPPGFDENASDAVNYGGIGVVIGHEISRAFDDQGAKFDYLGRLRNWWTDNDLKQFQERAACVADQFDHYFIEPGVHHNGKLVLGESIENLGGVKIAYLAYQRSLQGKSRPDDIDGFTPEQQFFIAWGQFRGDETRIEQQRIMVRTDPHPVAKFRVIGPLSNLPEFQKAFSCKPDSAMVRPPEKRCEVW